jgi:RNA polymerase sigma-70 factor (ECF subfamily)
MQYHKALHQFLMQRLRNAEDAADLAQEVYLRMLRVEKQELVRSPRDYLYGIASHVVYQFKFRHRRELVTFDSEAVDQAVDAPAEIYADEVVDRVGAQQHLEWALSQLPPMQRAVLWLRRCDQLSDQEIAQRLNLSVHTVKKYLFKAQARMRTLWNAQEERTHE